MDVSLLCHKFPYEPHTIVEGFGVFCSMPVTTGYTACSVIELPNLRIFEASLEAVQSPSKTSNCGMYCL